MRSASYKSPAAIYFIKSLFYFRACFFLHNTSL